MVSDETLKHLDLFGSLRRNLDSPGWNSPPLPYAGGIVLGLLGRLNIPGPALALLIFGELCLLGISLLKCFLYRAYIVVSDKVQV